MALKIPATQEADPLAEAERAVLDRWRASRLVWLSDLCLGGTVYAYRRCHGELTGETEQRRDVDGKTYTVRLRFRLRGQSEQDAIQARVEESRAFLSRETGLAGIPMAEAVASRPDLMMWLTHRGLLPRRPATISPAERRSGISEEQRQANAEALARSMV